MLNLENKIAIVTGCGSQKDGWGNGRAIATLLARQGATVIGTDLNIEHANNTKDYILKEGKVCEVYKVNMVVYKEVDAFFKTILEKDDNDTNVFLEVKEANLPAVKLYIDLGFEEVDRKERYYSDGSNAIFMLKKNKKYGLV